MALARRVREDEGMEGYRRGGYHPVYIGDTFNHGRYVVVSKVGWGHFSTVWRAYDTQQRRYVALKIVKSAPQYTDAAQDEIRIMERVSACDPTNTSCCLHLLNHFVHLGPNGTRLHTCTPIALCQCSSRLCFRRRQTRAWSLSCSGATSSTSSSCTATGASPRPP